MRAQATQLIILISLGPQAAIMFFVLWLTLNLKGFKNV